MHQLLLECYQNLDKLNETDLLPLLKSISHQCFINEYIWFVGSDEKEIIEKIKNRVLENEKLSPVEICILGSYKSLNHYKDINEIILNQKFDIEIETIITEQIKNFDLENELKKGIEKLKFPFSIQLCLLFFPNLKKLLKLHLYKPVPLEFLLLIILYSKGLVMLKANFFIGKLKQIIIDIKVNILQEWKGLRL